MCIRDRIGTVNFDGEHGLDAGTVSGRERSLIGSGYGCQIQIIVQMCIRDRAVTAHSITM